ncbi:MAG: type II secretion system protein [Myxococcota bacterium]
MIRRARRREAFTLLELMVALVAGLIAISSIYTISRASAENFQNQQRISQTQMAVRMAMEQIRLDVQRAAFLGTPNTAQERTCLALPDGNNFGGVEVRDGLDTANLANPGPNGVEADRLRLVGNYATTSRYVIDFGVGNRMRVDASTQGFRDSFGVVGTDYDADAFDDVFRQGRYLSVEDTDGDRFFLRITGTNAAQQIITFTPDLQNGSGNCVSGSLRQSFVSPLMRIEYAVVAPGDATVQLGNVYGDGAQQALDQARGTTPSVLIRREVSFDAGAAPIPGSERILLDYTANFDVDLLADQNPGVVAPLVFLDNGAAEAQTLANPHQVRAVVLDLAARTADQETNFNFLPPAAGQPVTRYQVNPARPGAARVRAVRSEIFLPNMVRP